MWSYYDEFYVQGERTLQKFTGGTEQVLLEEWVGGGEKEVYAILSIIEFYALGGVGWILSIKLPPSTSV